MRSENYRVFMLRLRRMTNGNRPKWVFSIKSPDAGKVQRFDSFGALILFLEQEMDAHEEYQLILEHQQKGDQS